MNNKLTVPKTSLRTADRICAHPLKSKLHSKTALQLIIGSMQASSDNNNLWKIRSRRKLTAEKTSIGSSCDDSAKPCALYL